MGDIAVVVQLRVVVKDARNIGQAQHVAFTVVNQSLRTLPPDRIADAYVLSALAVSGSLPVTDR